MRILITGGTGFVGSHLANYFTEAGHEVIVIGTKTEQKTKAAKYIGLHLSGLGAGRLTALGNIDVCFHQAANNDTLDLDRDEMMLANYEAPVQFLSDIMLFCNCKKIVYASSSAVYGNSPAPYKEDETPEVPLNPYGESKMEFDKWAMAVGRRTRGMSVVGLRYSNVYGIGEDHKGNRASMIYQLAKTMIKGGSPKLFRDGSQRRDWIYIKDVVTANLKAMEYTGSGIFNCGSGVATDFNTLVGIINKKLGTWINPTWIDCPFSDAYQTHTQADMSNAEKFLKFTPEYDVERGISEMINLML